ncbi:MAG: DinB family protein [Chitinophagaceae bacterium]|nr:DinB family protein [Chitinophagaceae bacterium]
MLIDKFNHTIDFWIKELEQYDFTQLCAKPTSTSWSVGQVYMHLIENTDWFIGQIKICVSTNDHSLEQSLPAAKAMFLNNDFPDEALEGPPSNADTLQPENKEQLMNCLLTLKTEINNVGRLISESQFNGKTKHPGLNYFSAREWFQFAEMHLRHHKRQKKRIDEFLRINKC